MNDINRPLKRGSVKASEYGPIVAYDFETTNIPTVDAFGPNAFASELDEWRWRTDEYHRIRDELHFKIKPERWHGKLRGEYDDMPRAFLSDAGEPADKIADRLGWTADELLDWCRMHPHPPRKPKRREHVYTLSVQPRYFTAYSGAHLVSRKLTSYADVTELLDELFTLAEPSTRMVAYNANRFDLRIILYAALASKYRIEPFVAKNSQLRGAVMAYRGKKIYWLDAMAMLGVSCTLREFLRIFAPQHEKLTLDFSTGEFDAHNPDHVRYAEQDSIALYHAMQTAEKTMLGITGMQLQPTIGALGIRAFVDNMPAKAICYRATKNAELAVRKYVMRGGYVFSRRYKGPLWTYDLNQAYAAAMRETALPAGRCARVSAPERGRPGIFAVTVERVPVGSVPFPMRDREGRFVECYGQRLETWLTTIEIECLRRNGWTVDIAYGYSWRESFKMTAWVNGLERRRREFDKTHPVNAAVKAIGCNAYGKTLQQSPDVRFVMSDEQPRCGKHLGQVLYDSDGREIPGFWIVRDDRLKGRCYERPQLGAFITASVRCKVYDAIMGDEEHFVKADTDSVSFTRPQRSLRLSAWEYGLWKLESDGALHIVIGKKVYWSEAAIGPGSGKVACKGLRIKQLSRTDFERWYAQHEAPTQQQVQLQTWKRAIAPTYARQQRRGTRT